MSEQFPLRMMDANLNRVAEGLRVVEDTLRFDLEDAEGCRLAREIRHGVRDSLRGLYPMLVSQRRVHTDPGVQLSKVQQLDGKLSREDLLTANFKRAQEGLRVLEESAHLLQDRDLAKKLEALRFAAYQLEYRTLHILQSRQPGPGPKLPAGIYALTSEEHSFGRSNLEVAAQILEAGVKVLQYREKDKKYGDMYRECLALRSLTREKGALFIINDHVDLALAVGADGVHLGQDDLPVPVVRSLLGSGKLIGVSTHSPEQAQRAVQDGADYIGVGPIFATKTKKDVCEPVGLDYLKFVVNNLNIPFVAIGGIKEHNLEHVLRAGASTIALVTEIVGSTDITAKILSLQAAMDGYAQSQVNTN